VVQIVLWYLDSGCSKHMIGYRSQLTNFVRKFLGTVKFSNDQIAKIIGYGDYQIGNVTISMVYYVEGLGHNLFSVGQFRDSDVEVAFRKHTCFVRNLEGVDLLLGSRGTNLYSLSIRDMMASSPICLLSKATKTKSWLWHRCLSYLNFGVINHLARQGLVCGLLRLKYEKDHLVNGKRYILVIVDDYSRFTWVKFLASKDEAIDFIIKFLKMIQVRLNATVRNIRTDNETEFVNKTLRDYYEQLLHDRKPNLSYLYVFGALCYPNNDSENLGKHQAKVDIGSCVPASVASPVPIVEAPVPVESIGTPSLTTVNQDLPSPSTSQTTS
ncbi:retrovirus-related pol polyprotein from transposon TNT 1-94, partial [Tanacetum coccineum]